MIQRFCENCRNILTLKEDDDGNVKNFCLRCNTFYDVLGGILLEIRKQEFDIYEGITRAMIYDNITYKQIRVQCPFTEDCENDILRVCLNKNTMKNIYVCPICMKGGDRVNAMDS